MFLDAGTVLYLGPGSRTDDHAHHAVQLVWARDGALSVTRGGRARGYQATLVPSHESHALEATGTIALLLVEPHGARGAALDRVARAQHEAEVAAALGGVGFPSATISVRAAAAWCRAAIDALAGPQPAAALSSVSRRAVAYVETHLDGVPRVADAARAIGLSASRLTHIFSSELGMPFRRFVLWSRIKRAVQAVQAGTDLTGAAFEAGFSDAAHLSRTFREMFGLPPSVILPHVELVGSWEAFEARG